MDDGWMAGGWSGTIRRTHSLKASLELWNTFFCHFHILNKLADFESKFRAYLSQGYWMDNTT